MAKVQCMAEVKESSLLAEGVYSLTLLAPEIADQAKAGQFVSLYCRNTDRILPRPISLCEIDREQGILRLVYRVVGEGTKEFSGLVPGDEIRVLGPLGNGFPTQGEHAVLIGGGIGIPPLVQLAKELEGEVTIVVGYRNADTFLLEELKLAADNVIVATEDGSLGTKGNVIDAVREERVHGDVIYSCGPLPMLRGVKEWGQEEQVPTWLSMEERMACGIGACLACVCRSTTIDRHFMVKSKRVCKEGPVFLSTDVEL